MGVTNVALEPDGWVNELPSKAIESKKKNTGSNLLFLLTSVRSFTHENGTLMLLSLDDLALMGG